MSDRKDNVVQKLERVRADFLEMVPNISEEGWKRQVFSETEEWVVSDLFCHVVDAEKSMTGLIQSIRDGGTGVPEDFDLPRWNASRVNKIKDKSIEELTADLTTNRTRLKGVIDTLDDDDLDKSGRHGSMRIMTIEEILHIIADHEQHHMEDIKKATT